MVGAGIHASKSDNIKIFRNIVYGNCWWTTSAPSAIVFAESETEEGRTPGKN